MVLCLVTLTDLKVRRAGLSASAELIVIFGPFGLKLPIHTHFLLVLGDMTGSPWNWVLTRARVKKPECWSYQMVEKVLRSI